MGHICDVEAEGVGGGICRKVVHPGEFQVGIERGAISDRGSCSDLVHDSRRPVAALLRVDERVTHNDCIVYSPVEGWMVSPTPQQVKRASRVRQVTTAGRILVGQVCITRIGSHYIIDVLHSTYSSSSRLRKAGLGGRTESSFRAVTPRRRRRLGGVTDLEVPRRIQPRGARIEQ